MLTQPEVRSFGLREPLSRVMGADRSSRWLGHRFEESLVKQAVGQLLASDAGVMPGRVVVMASSAELEVVTRGGLCGMLASAFRGSLELRELAYPVMREFLEQSSDTTPVLLVAIGTEKRPDGWPLPDFGKWVRPVHGPIFSAVAQSGLRFDMSGRWLRMDRKGNVTVLEPSSFRNLADQRREAPGNRKNLSERHHVQRPPAGFDFSWGIWAGLIAPQVKRVDFEEPTRIHFQALSLGSGSAARVVLSGLARERLSEFLAGEGIVHVSSPTLECSDWLLSEGGCHRGPDNRFRLVEQELGWGPSFSLLRFYCDARPGDRMVVLRDLSSIDLIAAVPAVRQGAGT